MPSLVIYTPQYARVFFVKGRRTVLLQYDQTDFCILKKQQSKNELGTSFSKNNTLNIFFCCHLRVAVFMNYLSILLGTHVKIPSANGKQKGEAIFSGKH